MEKLKPKLFSVMKSYTKEQFVKDVIAGIIVAIIALPLSIALALASGVTPEKGIYTAITAGFVISFLGGSRVQIAGPTAAFATIVAGIVAKNGMDGLIIATLLAGVILILMGFLRLGNLIKFIPYTITTGFTSGIAVTIFIGQIKDFLGLTIVSEEPLIETMDKLKAVFQFISTTNVQALLVGVISLLILILWQYLPGFCKKIPPSLIAVLVGSAMVALLNMNVNTIGDLYEISNKLPSISLPAFSLKTVQNVLPDAFTIEILAAIESLLSCVVADSMVNSRHRSNMELIAQGACTDSNFAAQFHLPGTFAPIASWELLKEAVKAAEENGAVYHVGNVNSSDVFYGDHALVPEGLDSLYGLKKMGVMALEMEAAALYMNAARYGKRALCICTVSDHILTGEETTSEQRQNSFTTMMKVALDTAVAMENK